PERPLGARRTIAPERTLVPHRPFTRPVITDRTILARPESALRPVVSAGERSIRARTRRPGRFPLLRAVLFRLVLLDALDHNPPALAVLRQARAAARRFRPRFTLFQRT